MFNDKISSYDQLLEKSGSVTFHTQSLRNLAIEMFKIKLDTSPEIAKDVFNFSTYNTQWATVGPGTSWDVTFGPHVPDIEGTFRRQNLFNVKLTNL